MVSLFCRAAARCNKGIEVLLAVALEHFVLVEVRVLRGPSPADDTVKKIRYLLHCQWCEERVFKKDGNMIEGNHICCNFIYQCCSAGENKTYTIQWLFFKS